MVGDGGGDVPRKKLLLELKITTVFNMHFSATRPPTKIFRPLKALSPLSVICLAKTGRLPTRKSKGVA